MSAYMSRIAPQHPNKKFWMFDAGPDYEGKEGGCSNKCENVYTVLFRQNEGSYLLGVLIGELLKAGSLPGAEGRTKVGIVGGLDIPVINDFIVGFKQGFAESGLDPEENVLVQYVGGDSPFNNPAKGKEIANAMYDQGAAIVWGVAGNSGNGVFEAAVEKKLYALGVDSDQYQTIADPAQKATIITSMLKNVDKGLLRAAKLDAEGKLGYGAPESVGVAADAVGIADNENYQKFVPKEIQEKVKAAYERVAKGEVVVASAFK
jgi:basic membrane protein A